MTIRIDRPPTTFLIRSQPVPFDRGNFSRASSRRYHAFKRDAAWDAKLGHRDENGARPILTGPVAVHAQLWVPGDPMDKSIRPWDAVNVYKSIEDAMSGVIYVDDWQVVRIEIELYPGICYQSSITVKEVD